MSETAELLNAVGTFIRRYVVLNDDQLVAVALWTAHTHVLDASSATPYINITSATKESGKTRMLEALELVVARPWLTGRVTAAVLARKVHAEKPTLLLDESDAAFGGDKEYAETLRGLLNSGYRRSGKSSVCVGQGASMSYIDLSTFCAKAIAGIDGNLPDTVASRSIRIRLKKKASDERVEPFFEEEAREIAEPLHQWLCSWGVQHVDALSAARPAHPPGLGDRSVDVWRPLFAIADLADGDWPERARAAAITLAGRRENDAIGVQLLADCANAFNGRDRLPTKDLIAALADDEEAPWATWHKGMTISPRALARLLEPFEIRSRTIRLDDGETAKGYMRESFEDAWRRHLPAQTPDLSVTTSQPAWMQGLSRDGCDSDPGSVTDEKGPDSAWIGRCDGVTDKTRVLGDEGLPELIDAAFHVGHITEAEWLERRKLHAFIEA